ncbi:MAG: PilT-like protein [Microgenomates group bacterium Gr01-1014_16]|nr:MAG: PilT-like protein [Microgenomates group bacterium Gr01-1014_16]
MTKSIVLDSFALIAYFRAEPASSKVTTLLQDAKSGKIHLFLSYINLAEVYYKTIRESGLDKGHEVLAILKALPIKIISLSDEIVLAAAEIKAVHPMSFADCFATALALENHAAVLTGDPEFKSVEKLVKIIWL